MLLVQVNKSAGQPSRPPWAPTGSRVTRKVNNDKGKGKAKATTTTTKS